ncbi:uncharacterized protein LOC143048513 isoform X2 [Mytilus galloprovincialis]|uniref:uncharacterized protein LOC143048513 isoform X2 n=1 Tax=Mytilus galloprovincialis TaxID=29158 RepID=UPI003F7C8A52
MDVNDQYLYWPLKRLKNELASRGAVGTGRKADLIERLRAYDRNQNFKNPVIHAPEPLEVEWPVSGFKQLKKEHKVIMPKLSREQIEAYFLYRMAEDNVYSGDLQSMTKGQLMFESHRVLACSILKNDNGIFLSGVVGAAMKKKAAAKDHDYCTMPLTEHWIDRANKVTQSDVDLIERSTRLQSCSPKWLEERRFRLTASTFGEICKVTSRRNTDKFCHSLFYGSNIQSKALSHGKNYEAKALKAFNLKFDKNAKRCGFYVSIDKSFLGASPDAILEDGQSIVEIKCPYNGRNEDVKPGPNFKFLQMDSNGNIVLKESSNYYDQIQGQLFVTKRSLCYFVVYTLCDLFVQKINLNEEYCNNCLVPKLESFYQRVFRPYVASTL